MTSKIIVAIAAAVLSLAAPVAVERKRPRDTREADMTSRTSRLTAAFAVLLALIVLPAAEAEAQGRRVWGVAAMAVGVGLLAVQQHCVTSGSQSGTFFGYAIGGTRTMEFVVDEVGCKAEEVTVTGPSWVGTRTRGRASWRSEFSSLSFLGLGDYEAEIEFLDGFTAGLEDRPAFLTAGLGAVAAGALAFFWPSAPVDVSPDIRNNGLRVSKNFGW